MNVPGMNVPGRNVPGRNTVNNNNTERRIDFNNVDSDNYDSPDFESLEFDSYGSHNSSDDENIERTANNYISNNSSQQRSQSMKLDILLTFIKGQRHLFNHCSIVCKHKLNSLMIPTILISSFNTIIGPFLREYSWSNNVSSGLNSVILLLISMMSYFKYESQSESFFNISKQYDRLETSVKLLNTTIYFQNNMDFEILNSSPREYQLQTNHKRIDNDKIQAIENRINEIKESQSNIIPSESRTLFPIIYHVNIFTLIQKMDLHRKQLYVKFKNVSDEIRMIYKRKPIYILDNKDDGRDGRDGRDDCDDCDDCDDDKQHREQSRLTELYKLKEQIKSDIYYSMNIYSEIEDIFSREINHANNTSLWCCYFHTAKKFNFSKVHPVIANYFTFVFAED